MPRLVLPGGPGGSFATSWVSRHFDAGALARFFGGCWIFATWPRSERSGLLGDPAWPTSHEVKVGHENFYRPGTFCWAENDFAYRGAVRFPLTARDVTTGFHERERATLTWRKVDGGRTRAFIGCTQALVSLGPAEFDWEAGIYQNGSTAERHNLRIAGTPVMISDADASVPRSMTPNLRRVDVTDIVRGWVEHTRPNFGFVLMGAETFRSPPTHTFGSGIWVEDSGYLWESCVGIYTGFELVFAPIGYTPSYGRAAADL